MKPYPDRDLERFAFRDKMIFDWTASVNEYFKDGTSEYVHQAQDDFYRALTRFLSVEKLVVAVKLPQGQGNMMLFLLIFGGDK